MQLNKLKIQMSSGMIKRYHTHYIVGEQTVASHAYGVAQIVRHLTNENCSKQLIMAALDHDTMEFFTGDIPFPAKKNFNELDKVLDGIEEQLSDQHEFIYNLTDKEKTVLKTADLLEMAFFGEYQMSLGNRHGREILEATTLAIKKLPSAEVPQEAKDLVIKLEEVLYVSK